MIFAICNKVYVKCIKILTYIKETEENIPLDNGCPSLINSEKIDFFQLSTDKLSLLTKPLGLGLSNMYSKNKDTKILNMYSSNKDTNGSTTTLTV